MDPLRRFKEPDDVEDTEEEAAEDSAVLVRFNNLFLAYYSWMKNNKAIVNVT